MLVWMIELSCWLILVRLCVLCCWLSWPLTLVMQSGGRKLTYIIMVVICNFYVEYRHFTVKQTYKNVLNNAVKVTNSLWASLAIPYIAIRTMKNNGLCGGGNVNSYLWLNSCMNVGGTQWRCWLRHCATSRKVAGSIPDSIIGIFHWHNPSGRTVALGSTQHKWVPGIFPGGKDGRCVGLTTLPPSCADCLEICEPQPPGTL